MIVSNLSEVPGRSVVQTLGPVKGNTVRAKHFGKDFLAGLRTIVGGEIREYTEMLYEARAEAEARMVAEAQQLGADAVLCVRYTTSAVMQNAAEILAYGTAVKLG
jgi:uncharacterized protein YbjQ (UPF0145 family)